jgi:hypothetical protein
MPPWQHSVTTARPSRKIIQAIAALFTSLAPDTYPVEIRGGETMIAQKISIYFVMHVGATSLW